MTRLLPDFREFLASLNDNAVKYLVIGGYAVGHYGYVRPTGDIDIWVARDPANAQKLAKVIVDFGFSGVDETTFTHPSQIIRMGVPPVQIEISTFIDGVEFEDCYAARTLEEFDGIAVPIIGLNDLRINKRASGRLKDLSDLEHLPVSLPDAAAHVVADPAADNSEGQPAVIDWETTLAFRRHLWRYGFGVAEAMDTAQRGFGLEWEATKELIRRSLAEAQKVGGLIACGAGTDQLGDDYAGLTLDNVIAAYEEQIDYIERHGGRVILMASRALAAVAKTPDDYLKVYGHLLSKVKEPVILHWLGEMFDPQLKGYWGSEDWQKAGATLLNIIRKNAVKVDGMKMSLLDAVKEIYLRRQLPEGVKMYTGDDFNYDTLIKGDGQGFSHGLLGIFDPIAPAAAAALVALEAGDTAVYDRILSPTVPLARHIFEPPTFYYKTGIVFLAYLNAQQEHFKMVGGLEHKRSLMHLVELFKLADRAGLLGRPELAVKRMEEFLETRSVGA